MSIKKRKYHSSNFKAKVALEALKERETINQIATRYKVHPNMVTQWKRQLFESLPNCFNRKNIKESKHEALTDSLYQQIGKLKVDLDWLKKKSEAIRSRKTYVD